MAFKFIPRKETAIPEQVGVIVETPDGSFTVVCEKRTQAELEGMDVKVSELFDEVVVTATELIDENNVPITKKLDVIDVLLSDVALSEAVSKGYFLCLGAKANDTKSKPERNRRALGTPSN